MPAKPLRTPGWAVMALDGQIRIQFTHPTGWQFDSALSHAEAARLGAELIRFSRLAEEIPKVRQRAITPHIR